MILTKRRITPPPPTDGLYRKILNYNGFGRIGAFKSIDPFYTFQVLKNTDGKYYFAAHPRMDQNRDPYLYKYNPDTNTIEQFFRIELGIASIDNHRIPVINTDSSGNIYCIVEELIASPTGHATPLRIYKSNSAFDVTAFALIKTISGRWSYPTLHISGTRFFVSARGSTDTVNFIRGQYWYHDSTDSGANFTATKLYDSGDENRVAYFQRIYAYDGSIWLVLNERYNTDLSWPFVAVIKRVGTSSTWSNADGTWTKDVSGGHITRAEMLANCLVVAAADSSHSVNFEGGVVKTSGGVRICVSMNTKTGNIYTSTSAEVTLNELRFYRPASGWTYNNVSIQNCVSYWEYDRPTQYINNDESFDDIAFIDFTSTRSVYKKRSSDNFQNTTTTKLLEGNSRNMMGQATFNASTESDYFMIVQDPRGNKFEDAAELIGDYSYLTLLRL